MKELSSIFERAPSPSAKFLAELEGRKPPRSRYILAMTPRSGSSYLCDAMAKTRRFGMPDEFMNSDFLPDMLRSVPAKNADDFLQRILLKRVTGNGLTGLKASWFQFRNYLELIEDFDYIKKFRFIYLRRRDVVMQAISLYKATATDVFHTNVEHDGKNLNALANLKYSFNKIEKWHHHILKQEQGWDRFFYENRIFPLHIFYEDIEQDALQLMKRIATFVAVDPNNVQMPQEASVFRKMRDKRNFEWAQRFAKELQEREENLPDVFGGIS